MNFPSNSRFNVSTDDIRRYAWQRVLATSTGKECHHFYSALVAEAKRLQDVGDDLGHRVHAFLYVVASFHPNYDMQTKPYGSMWSGFDGRRSLNTEDLTEDDLATLAGIVSEIADPEYRARIADVLWVTKKDYKAAQLAINAFLESADRLQTGDMWPPYVNRLERAARIASHRGFEVYEERVVFAVEDAIGKFENNLESGILCLRLMGILLGLGRGDAVRYAALAERFAQNFAGIDDWHFSESYWELSELWHRRNKNDSDGDRCRLAAAECNISRAEAGLANQESDFMYRAHWLGRGLEALRRAKADPQRIQEVHKKFLEMEKRSLSEMKTVELDREAIPRLSEVETEAQKQAADHVRGHSLFRAIIQMANVTRPVVLADLTKQCESISEETIWDKIVATTAVDHFGKVTDIIEPVGTEDEEGASANKRKRLTHHARTIHWPTKVVWFIEPARLALMEEHAVRRRDLHFLILNNPFVPPGHEDIYIRGLQAGFYGDWLQTMHLLVPQIENSIRYVLNQNGIITTTLREGIQAEKNINELLPSEEVKKILGEDLVFDLRGILIERFGHNLRNESAHGLMPESAFYNPSSVYLWWLILHVCWKGFLMAHASSTPQEQQPEGESESS